MPRSIVQNLKFGRPNPDLVDVEKLGEFINVGYMTQRREPAVTKKTSFAPSAIGGYSGQCPRRWFLAFKGESMSDDDFDAVGIATMQTGTDAHARIQRALKDAGILVEDEREILCEDPPIRGFADAVVHMDGKDVVVELKTTRMESFNVRQATMKAMPQHMYQILMYLKIEGLEHGVLLYENRNDLSMVAIPVRMTENNQKIIDTAFDWMRMVYANYENNTLPTRPFTKKSKVCKSCPFYTACWDGEDGVVDLPPMEVAKF